MNAFTGAISPYNELLSYETLWLRQGATIKKVSEYLEGITVFIGILKSLFRQRNFIFLKEI
jgi:hypothetical protein